MPKAADPVNAADMSAPASGGVSAQALVDYATQKSFLNTRYVDHATIPSWGPGKGWDCSSYTSYVMKKFGVNLPAYSDAQFQQGTPVDKGNLQPGDLVFFHTNANKQTGHVGIYIGGGKMVNAANPSSGTQIQPVTWGTYVGARRYIGVKGTAKVPVHTDSGNHELAGDSQAADIAQAAATGTSTPPAGQDTFNMADALAVGGFDMKFVDDHPDVKKVFIDAVNKGWFTSGSTGQANFTNALHQTDWWRDNSTYARDYLIKESTGGKDWENQKQAATQFVKDRAQAIGAKLSDGQASILAKYTLMNGWNADATRAKFLDQALTGQLAYKDAKPGGAGWDFSKDTLDYGSGAIVNTVAKLRESAQRNGLTYSDNWYNSAAKSVAAGLGTVDDYLADIRKTAATQFPVFSDKIIAGADAIDIASPYLNKMAQTLEMDANQISLSDPMIKKALGSVDAKGNPIAAGLWDFEKELKQDPRWGRTKQANDQVDRLIAKVGSMFGFSGGF
jgi:hypothetical protein